MVDSRGRARVAGARKGSWNIVVSDKTVTGDNESGFDDKTGLYVTDININHVWKGNFFPLYQNSIEHELAHVLLGHVYIKNPTTWQIWTREFSADTTTFVNRWGLSHSFNSALDHLFGNP